MFNVATSLELGKNGRLGNMMFQIAATIGYAAGHGKMWSFPDVEEAKYFKDFPVGACGSNHVIIKEEGFCYKELPSFPGRDVSLSGYFQSEKYFESFKDTVRSAFTFSDFIMNGAEEFMRLEKEAGYTRTVSIHMRFGDYVGNKFYANLLETSYYEDAIFYVLSHSSPKESIKFLVFSDETDKALKAMHEIFRRTKMAVHFDIVSTPHPCQDMCLMSLCDAGIMANSSFSFWGNYLGKNKKIISPMLWFGPSSPLNSKDIYTKEMILL